MYRILVFIILLFSSTVAFAESSADKAYCSKSEECMEQRWLELKQAVFGNKEIKSGDGVIELDTPKRAPDGAFVPINFKTEELKNDHVSKVHLLIDMNPSPYAGTFTFTNKMNKINLSTRIRLDAYSHVRVIAETKKGDYFMTANFVKASGGCAAPPLGDMAAMVANAGEMKVKLKNNEDNIVNAKIMIQHPQFNGLQAHPVTTQMIEAFYIEKINVTYNDEILMALESDISISQDPTFRFNFPSDKGGKLKITASDTDGKKYTFSKEYTYKDNQLTEVASK